MTTLARWLLRLIYPTKRFEICRTCGGPTCMRKTATERSKANG